MESLYDLTVRLNLSTAGFGAAIALAVRSFQTVQAEAGRTQTAVQSALGRQMTTQASVQRATTNVDSAQRRYNQALQDHMAISSRSGATSGAAARSFDRLAIAHNSLTNAQLSQSEAARLNAAANTQHAAALTAAASAAERHNRMMGGMNALAVGGVMTGAGLLGLGFLRNAAQQAMQFQTVQTDVSQGLTDARGRRLAPAQNAAAIAALQTQEVNIGLRNQMSMTDVAHIVDAAVHSGMTRTDVLLGTRTQASILPALSNFAEVLQMTRGYKPEESATVASQFAHIFGVSFGDAAGFSKMTNLLGRALFVSPATPREFLTLTSQFAGTLRPLYGTTAAGRNRFTQDAIVSSLLLTELGQETRGGTQLGQLISRTLGTHGVRSGPQNRALARLHRLSGVNFYNAQGDLRGMPQVIQALALARNAPGETSAKFTQTMIDAFGRVGGRIAGLLADPVSAQRLTTLRTMLSPQGIPDYNAIQQVFNQTTQGQINQFNRDMNTLTTLIGQQLLPALDPAVRMMTGLVRAIVQLAQAHPQILSFVTLMAALTTAFLLIAGPIAAVAGTIVILGAAFGTVAAVLGPLVEVAGVIVGVVAAIVGAPVWVIVAIGIGIVAAIVALVKFHDAIGTFIHGLVQAVRNIPILGGLMPAQNQQAPPGQHPPHPGDVYREGHWFRVAQTARGNYMVLDDPKRRGAGGGTRLPVPAVHNWHITVNGADHATTQHLAATIVNHIGKTLEHDQQWQGLGLHDLSPGPMGV